MRPVMAVVAGCLSESQFNLSAGRSFVFSDSVSLPALRGCQGFTPPCCPFNQRVIGSAAAIR